MRSDADLAERGVAEHVRKRGVVQAAGAKRVDLLIEAGADARDFGFRDTGTHTECRHEVIDAAGRHTVNVGLHDHRVQRPIDAATPFQQRGKERPGPQFGDLDLDIAGSGRHRLGPVPIAVGGAPVSALVAARADHLGGFSLDQRLQTGADQLGDTAPASADLSASSWASRAE